MVRLIRWFAHLALCLVWPAHAAQVYTVAIVPQMTAVDIGQRWTPLLNRLEKDTGYGFQLRVTTSFASFERDFRSGNADFVFLNPYHAVMASEAQGYVPLVHSGKPLAGILLVDKSGPIRRLADLDGQRIGFPAPNPFVSSLYMRALLTEKEKIHFTPVYVGSHSNVYRSVANGDVAAGGGAQITLAMQPAALQEHLRVLYTTPGVASLPLVAHPRVPKVVRDRVQAALLACNADPDGRRLLAAAELAEPVAADYARDYAPLKRLGVERYVVLDQP